MAILRPIVERIIKKRIKHSAYSNSHLTKLLEACAEMENEQEASKHGNSREHIATRKDRINECIKDLTEEVVQLRIDFATLEIKASGKHTLFGFLGGLIPTIAMLIFWLVKTFK